MLNGAPTGPEYDTLQLIENGLAPDIQNTVLGQKPGVVGANCDALAYKHFFTAGQCVVGQTLHGLLSKKCHVW